MLGGGGIAEPASAVLGGGGTAEQEGSTVASGGGIAEHEGKRGLRRRRHGRAGQPDGRAAAGSPSRTGVPSWAAAGSPSRTGVPSWAAAG